MRSGLSYTEALQSLGDRGSLEEIWRWREPKPWLALLPRHPALPGPTALSGTVTWPTGAKSPGPINFMFQFGRMGQFPISEPKMRLWQQRCLEQWSHRTAAENDRSQEVRAQGKVTETVLLPRASRIRLLSCIELCWDREGIGATGKGCVPIAMPRSTQLSAGHSRCWVFGKQLKGRAHTHRVDNLLAKNERSYQPLL